MSATFFVLQSRTLQIRALLAALALSVILLLSGCATEETALQANASQATVPIASTLPSHTFEAYAEAGVEGMLYGRETCLWFGGPTETEASQTLVFPVGWTAAARDGDVVLFDETGSEVARTGERVAFGGNEDARFDPCVEGADGTWVVTDVVPLD